MTTSHTDCRSEIGITVGLVDAIISVLRVLSPRDLTEKEVIEALTDLKDDLDFQTILEAMKKID